YGGQARGYASHRLPRNVDPCAVGIKRVESDAFGIGISCLKLTDSPAIGNIDDRLSKLVGDIDAMLTLDGGSFTGDIHCYISRLVAAELANPDRAILIFSQIAADGFHASAI